MEDNKDVAGAIEKIKDNQKFSFSVIDTALKPVTFDQRRANDPMSGKAYRYIAYGGDNMFPNYLIDLYQRSSKHAAIVNGKVNYIMGKGWETINGGTLPMPNPVENMNRFTRKLALDLELFDGFAIKCVRRNDGAGFNYYHVPFNSVRTNAAMNEFYISRQWAKSRQTDLIRLPAFAGAATAEAESLYYYQVYTPTSAELPIYPMPSYISSAKYIEIDAEIANFHLANIQNGFWGSFFVTFYTGVPSKEEKLKIEAQLKKKFSGSGAAGKIIVGWGESKDRGVDLTPLTPNNMDKLFLQLNDTVQQEIFIGHRVTSGMLFGVRQEGQLGGRNELIEAWELMKATYTAVRQQMIEEVINYLFTGDQYLRALRIVDGAPVAREMELTETTLGRIFSTTELRKIAAKMYDVELDAPSPAGFSSQKEAELREKRILGFLATRGRPATDFIIHKSKPLDTNDVRMEEERMMRICLGNEVRGALKEVELLIVQYIEQNGPQDAESLSKNLDIPKHTAEQLLKGLIDGGIVERVRGAGREANDLTIIGKVKNTDAGSALVPASDPAKLRIMFRYVKDPTVDGPTLIPTSRPFCVNMVNMNRLWDRQDIQTITDQEDYNVFLYRGGWYHRPDGENTPYCRHIWESVAVTETGPNNT